MKQVFVKTFFSIAILFCNSLIGQIYTPIQNSIAPNENMGIGQINPEGRLHIQSTSCRPSDHDGMSFPSTPGAVHIKLESVEKDNCGILTDPPVISTPTLFLSQWWDINGEINSGLRFRTSYDNINYLDLLHLNENTSTLYANNFQVGNYFNVNPNFLNLNNTFSVNPGSLNLMNTFMVNPGNLILNNLLYVNMSGMSLIPNGFNLFTTNQQETRVNSDFIYFGTGFKYHNAMKRLDIDGKIFAREVEITINPFPDYVFEPSYQLKSLSEVKAFIETEKHLPNLPSAKDIETNGIGMGELARKQMEKIEELTLYLVQMNERINQLENK